MLKVRGPSRVSAIRAALYGLSLLVNIGTSVILARRLVAKDYAAYQFATKRIIQYASIPMSFFGLWAYRYLVTRKRGAFGALLTLLLISVIISIPLGVVLELKEANVSFLSASLAALVLVSQNVYFTATSALDALRPVRRALLSLVYRVLYFASVAVALYLATPSLEHAFEATVASLVMGAGLGALWLRDLITRHDLEGASETLLEWAKTSKPLLISYVIGFLASLDALVAYELAGDLVVAAFFIAAAVATLVREAANNGLSYLHQYVLRTGDFEGAARAIYIVMIAASPFLLYAAAHPVYVIYVFNPVYSWSSEATRIFMVVAVIEIFNAGVANMAYGSIREVGPESIPAFTRLSLLTSLPSAVYLATLAGLLVTLHGLGLGMLILGWAIAYGIRFVMSTVITYRLLIPGEAKKAIAGYLGKLGAFLAVSAALAVLIAPFSAPRKGIISSIAVLAPPGLLYLAVYFSFIVLADKDVRRSVRGLASQILFSGPIGAPE
ncbi:MAG: hypothetical protein ACP5FT_03285 [Acidilobus sp.]